MEQLKLFEEPRPYKYIIDTSSILSQKNNEQNRRTVHKRMWEYIDSLVSDKIIVTCTEIFDEIGDEEYANWLKSLGCVVLEVDEEIQRNVTTVVTNHPKLIEFKRAKSSGDAFLIATAIKYDLIIVTEENRDKQNKIPRVASALGIRSMNIIELCENEGKEF